MADIKSEAARSQNMAAIKGKDTKPEIYLRHLLFQNGYRFRKNAPGIVGHPDIWLRKYNTAIFVHGCFWHRHAGCRYAYAPKSRVDFWSKKFENNKLRDQKVQQELQNENIKCLVVWECTIKKMMKSEDDKAVFLKAIICFLKDENKLLEL